MSEEINKEIEGFDMDNPPKVVHNWVKRGIVFSCEGADHPNHQYWPKQVDTSTS